MLFPEIAEAPEPPTVVVARYVANRAAQTVMELNRQVHSFEAVHSAEVQQVAHTSIRMEQELTRIVTMYRILHHTFNLFFEGEEMSL